MTGDLIFSPIADAIEAGAMAAARTGGEHDADVFIEAWASLCDRDGYAPDVPVRRHIRDIVDRERARRAA